MKFLSFTTGKDDKRLLGVLMPDGRAYNLSAYERSADDRTAGQAAGKGSAVPTSMEALIAAGDGGLEAIQRFLSLPNIENYQLDPAQITYLPPLLPRKNVFCVGRNYREHIIEGNIANGRPADSFPPAIEFFTKAATAIIGHQESIRRHRALTDSLDYEVELAIVIGRRGIDIAPSNALDHVFGYTVLNDVTARDLQKRHGQWFKGKSLDTSCPIGPVIVHRSAIKNPNALRLKLEVNGEIRQDNTTSDMIFNIEAIIAELSAGMTLEPGDIICTGTPQGVGFAMKPPRCLDTGDVVSATIEGIGTLTNTVIE